MKFSRVRCVIALITHLTEFNSLFFSFVLMQQCETNRCWRVENQPKFWLLHMQESQFCHENKISYWERDWGKRVCNTKNTLSKMHSSARPGWLFILVWVFWIWNGKVSNFFCFCVRRCIFYFCLWWVAIRKARLLPRSLFKQQQVPRRSFDEKETQWTPEDLFAWVWFGWGLWCVQLGFVLWFAAFFPVKALGPSRWVMGRKRQGGAGREVGAEREELCLHLLLQVWAWGPLAINTPNFSQPLQKPLSEKIYGKQTYTHMSCTPAANSLKQMIVSFKINRVV